MNRIRFALLAALVLILASCGGGGSSTPPPPPPITLTIAQTSFPYGIIGQPYPGAQLTARGGTPPYTFAASSVPAGMNFSSDGKLTGTTPGTVELIYPLIITVNDSAGHTCISTVSLSTYFPLSATIANREISSGIPYQGSLTILIGQASVTATAKLVSGSLPPGLSFGTASPQGPNPSLAIAGTPTQSGIFNFTVEVTDTLSPPRISQVPLKMFVDVPELLFTDQGTFTSGYRTQAYQQAVATRGGVPPITCALAPGSTPLPGGLTISSGCFITGTPTANGTFTFTLRATDSGAQQTVNKAFSLSIVEPLSVGPLPDATTGEIYSTRLQITGGTPPYTLMPDYYAGCCFVFEQHDTSLHGVFYQPGIKQFSLQITDALGQTMRTYPELNVKEGPFRLGSEILPRAKVGLPYVGMLTVVSGKRPVTWSLESGTLPAGINVLQTFDDVQLRGTPSVPGSYPLTLRVTDSSSPAQTMHVPVTLQIVPKLGRNDSLLTGDSIAGASYSAGASLTISPFADPIDLANPDQDYYHFRAFAGDTIEVYAYSRTPVDPVIEVTDSNGQRFASCRNPSDDTPDADGHVDLSPFAFDDVCMNDDIDPGVRIDSMLLFRVPGASGTIVDFYVHVLDFRGDARPDFEYSLYLMRTMEIID